MNTLLLFITLIVSAVAPVMPNNQSYVNIAYASPKSTLAGSALIVSVIPDTPEKSLPDEFSGEKITQDEEVDLIASRGILGLKNDNVEDISGLIKKYSAQYAVSYDEMTRVMMCESTGKADAVGDNGLAFGLFQFHENTFNLFSKELGEKLDWKNSEHQIKLASWSFANGKQRHWTCYKKTKNF